MGGFNNVIFSKTHLVPHYNVSVQIDRLVILLKDGETVATVHPIFSQSDVPPELLKFLTQEYNDEIARGDTQPFFEPLTIDEFRDYWFGQFAAIMVLGEDPTLNTSATDRDWATKCLGTFFVKASYPGRSAHVCTANFLVNAGIREKGIGKILTECFLAWSSRLSYKYVMIELIFETNLPAISLMKRFTFDKIGVVKGCGLLKGVKDQLVDSLTYGRELDSTTDLEPDGFSKHDKIKAFLLHRKYPEGAGRLEKSRLRSLSAHYSILDGKLMLKGKEVVTQQSEKLRIARELHEAMGHGGINKTTSAISCQYHWPKMKTTASQIIKSCQFCIDLQESIGQDLPSKRGTQPRLVDESSPPADEDVFGESPNIEPVHSFGEISLDEEGLTEVVELAHQQHQNRKYRLDDVASNTKHGINNDTSGTVEAQILAEAHAQAQAAVQYHSRHQQSYPTYTSTDDILNGARLSMTPSKRQRTLLARNLVSALDPSGSGSGSGGTANGGGNQMTSPFSGSMITRTNETSVIGGDSDSEDDGDALGLENE